MLCVRVAAEMCDVREKGAVGCAVRQRDRNGRPQRERAKAQNGFCAEPGVLIVEVNRKRLPVRNRGELLDLVHGMEHDGKFSHGKSSCNGLYNRGGIRYNKAAKRQWTTDRSFKKTEAGTNISSAII